MCRYGMSPYKQHYLCIPCRFSAKYEYPPRCPHCRSDMVAMGLDFRPPRKRAANQWKKLELLVQRGVLFASCGCNGPGWRPATFAEAKRNQSVRRRGALR